jgi:hypothetical protein
MKTKIHIVTASFGENKDYNFVLPEQKDNGFDVTVSVYNDTNTHSRHLSLHPRTKGKIPKMLEWLEFDSDYYIWFDSKFKIKSENFIEKIISLVGDKEIMVCKHPSRTTIKSELDFVNSQMIYKNKYLLERYSGERMEEQVNHYLNDSDFIDNNLFAMGFFVYSKKLVINKNYNLLTDWFFHNCYWSIQDQLSFPYLLQKHKTNYDVFDFNILDNEYFKHGG